MTTAREFGCAIAKSLRIGVLCSAGWHGKICDAFTAAVESWNVEQGQQLQQSLDRERKALEECARWKSEAQELGTALGREQHARVEMSRARDAATALATKTELAFTEAAAERDLVRSQLAAAVEALGKWKCVSCRGLGFFPASATKCRTCNGNGAHPIAAAALARL